MIVARCSGLCFHKALHSRYFCAGVHRGWCNQQKTTPSAGDVRAKTLEPVNEVIGIIDSLKLTREPDKPMFGGNQSKRLCRRHIITTRRLWTEHRPPLFCWKSVSTGRGGFGTNKSNPFSTCSEVQAVGAAVGFTGAVTWTNIMWMWQWWDESQSGLFWTDISNTMATSQVALCISPSYLETS